VHNTVSLKEQAKFFLPLAMTSFVIIMTHSLFNAGLARLPSPEMLLAAFAVSKSLMFIFQAPLMMIRQTITALVDHRQNFRKTAIFLAFIVFSVVLFMSIFAFSSLSRLIFREIMGLSGQTLEEAVLLFRIMVLFPVFVSIRDFFAGFSLKFRTTPLIGLSSVTRFLYVLMFIIFIDKMMNIRGAYLTGLMYIGAVAIEALIMAIGTRVLSKSIPQGLKKLDQENQRAVPPALSYGHIFNFFLPLTATALIQTALLPIVNGGLARTAEPDLALAVFAVAWGLGMVVLSPFMTFHQVPLHFIREDMAWTRKGVQKFALILAVISSLILLVLSFTELGYLVLRRLIGASHEISILSADILKLMALMPFLMVTREYYWGILMQRRTTRFIWKGKAINVVTLVIVLTIMVLAGPANPAVIGAVSLISCELSEFLYLYIISRKTAPAEMVPDTL
jgi:progressive ankylosis protein